MAKPGEHKVVPCEWCHTSYRQSRSDQQFCSGKCASASWRERKRPSVACAHCGAAFTRRHSNHRYCGGSCSVQVAKALKQAKNSGVGKGGATRGKEIAPRQTCEVCGGLFYAPPVLIRRGGGKFCSKKCQGEFVGTHPEYFPKNSGSRNTRSGTRDDIGIFVRSAWEANYARYLNWLIQIGQIQKWEYEAETFEFVGIKRGSRFYTPDFKVTNADGSVEYHEVKGWMDPKSKTKLKRMAKYHPRVKVILIDKPTYRDIFKQFGRRIPGWEMSR